MRVDFSVAENYRRGNNYGSSSCFRHNGWDWCWIGFAAGKRYPGTIQIVRLLQTASQTALCVWFA